MERFVFFSQKVRVLVVKKEIKQIILVSKLYEDIITFIHCIIGIKIKVVINFYKEKII